jgi:hypothetical protein
MYRGCFHPSNLTLPPGLPAELRGFGTLHAPFLTERRTRGLLLRCVAGNPGSGPRVLAEDSAWCSFFALHPLRKRSSPEADGREAALETIPITRSAV